MKKPTSTTHSDRGVKGAVKRWGRSILTSGKITIGTVTMDCYVLNSKERTLSLTSMTKALNMKPGGYKTGDKRVTRFFKGKLISKCVPRDLYDRIENPIKVKSADGASMYVYPADILPDLCNAILTARDNNLLQKQQLHIAERADILMRGMARVGIVALVDEATGYQYHRESTALATILEQYIAKEAAAWVKTFPDMFYEQLFRLRGIGASDFHKKPQYFGHITNDLVYKRLAPSVLEELKKKGPRDSKGNRVRQHQWLTRSTGAVELRGHIKQLTMLMQESKTWDIFMKKADKYLPLFDEPENAIQPGNQANA